jgi:ADP-heptose:LPS heptosyltransferase
MPNILIFRPDNIGDVVLFSGALKHIRNLYPRDRITLAVQPHIVNLVELCPYVDNCIPINRISWRDRICQGWGRGVNGGEGLVRKLNRQWNRLPFFTNVLLYPVKSPQPEHLEMISSLNHDLNLSRIVGITGCTVNAPPEGYPAGLEPAHLFTDFLDVSGEDPWRHELLTTLDFLRFLGCPVSDVEEILPELWLAESDRNHLAGERRKGSRIIGLFPGAAFAGRCWAPENYGKLAQQLGSTYTYAVFGSSTDEGLAQRVASVIEEACGGADIINLAGKTTLRELAKTIAACDLLVSTETSGLHIAIAAGVPSIGIMGGGHYGRFAPWGDPERGTFLTKNLRCFHCNWECPEGDFGCIQGVSPEEVTAAAERLLASGSPPTTSHEGYRG